MNPVFLGFYTPSVIWVSLELIFTIGWISLHHAYVARFYWALFHSTVLESLKLRSEPSEGLLKYMKLHNPGL